MVVNFTLVVTTKNNRGDFTMKKIIVAAAIAAVSIGAMAEEKKELLRIIGTDTRFVVHTKTGPLEITRTMTPCAKNKGWLQPLIPVPGVHPVTELELLPAMNDKDSLIVDMRETEDRVKGTIPNSYAFCNGPVCPQSPTAIAAMVRDGFPVDKIYYYRGGMLDWDALGFPIIQGDF